MTIRGDVAVAASAGVCNWSPVGDGVRVASIASAVLAALLPNIASTAAGHFLSITPGIERERKAVGRWRLALERDRYSGATRCRLTGDRGRLGYADGAVYAQFWRGLDTTGGAYRVDNAALRFARDELPELVRRGAPIDGPGLDNPTGGRIWLPLERVRDAQFLDVQPAPGRHARRFRIAGLDAALGEALARGCAV